MKRLLAATVTVVAAIGLMAPAQAGVAKTVKEGPYGPAKFQDYGSCTNLWANITQMTTYMVGKPDKDGTYHMSFLLSGPFASLVGQSPAACATGTDDGNTVKDGIKGKMSQTFYIDVFGGKFNSKAKCDDSCGTDYTWDGVNVFVSNFFGKKATWSLSTTKLVHESASSTDKSLCANKWVTDYDPNTGIISKSKGDIASTCN